MYLSLETYNFLSLIVLLFWIYLFLLTLVFVLHWLFLHWEILLMLLSQFPLNFYLKLKGDAPFYFTPVDSSCADWDGLRDHLKNSPREYIFKQDASAAGTEFCAWVPGGIDV